MGKGTDQVEFAQRLGKRPALKFARCGDTVECDVREPHPQTHRLTLLTPEATAFANELLARPNTPWRLVERHETPNARLSGRQQP